MTIEEAFTADAIATVGVDVGAEEEDELRSMIGRVLETQEVTVNPKTVNACVLMFIAGRAYQYDQNVINVPMSPTMIAGFLSYLSEEA